MKGYLTSFAGLFRGQAESVPSIVKVEIPLIQRDYAQGRPDSASEDIRRDFLEVLFKAMDGTEEVGLDFVYGRVESDTFHPLDGQQRLTTLFLIHWYVASLAGVSLSDQPWIRFSYETRPSARLFCESLVRHPLPQSQDAPAEWIKDQPWYLYTWWNDPTIQSMLVVIDAIHEEASRAGRTFDAEAAWTRLTGEASSAVSFYFLPLKDMESEEDLYIKMNSRGKPLTEFENFKAHFEQDIRHSARADAFAHRIDGRWSDLMWPLHGGDNIVDDELMRMIDYITEIAELREGQLASGKIGPRARAIFGPENPRSEEHLEFLFSVLDAWADASQVYETFDAVFSTAAPGAEGYDPQKVVLFETAGIDLFSQCCHLFDSQRGGNRAFTLQQSLLLYAVLMHRIKKTADFPRRVRVLRNLLAASAENEVRRLNMPGLLKDVEALIVDGDLDQVTTLSFNQRQDERDKASFLRVHPELATVLYRLEDHPILRGTLSAFELDAETFQHRAAAFETAFSDPTLWLDLTGALLATGEYQRRRPKSHAWQFGTASPGNLGVWRFLLTEAARDDLGPTRLVVGEFLDRLSATHMDLVTYLRDVQASWLAEREQQTYFDWRYYLVKYPAMRGSRDEKREGRTGIYWGLNGQLGYSLAMLRTETTGGYYRDPFLLQVWLSSGVQDAVRNQWFSGDVNSARWLPLERSEVGIRSVAEGFELRGCDDEELNQQFFEICERRPDVVSEGERILLRVPQVDREGNRIDAVDRVLVGAQLVRELVEAGL